jgi:hypothetical protein
LEGSAVPNGMLEVPAIPEGVTHVLVVWALGVEDVVQCSFTSAGCSSGARGGWSGGVDFFTRPLLPTFVGLLVHVASWCRRCRLCSSDEVLSSFVGGDVEVSHPVLEGKPNANHVRARISYSRTQQLHNMDIITQCSK